MTKLLLVLLLFLVREETVAQVKNIFNFNFQAFQGEVLYHVERKYWTLDTTFTTKGKAYLQLFDSGRVQVYKNDLLLDSTICIISVGQRVFCVDSNYVVLPHITPKLSIVDSLLMAYVGKDTTFQFAQYKSIRLRGKKKKREVKMIDSIRTLETKPTAWRGYIYFYKGIPVRIIAQRKDTQGNFDKVYMVIDKLIIDYEEVIHKFN